MTYEVFPHHENQVEHDAKILHHYIKEENRAAIDALRTHGVGELSPFITLDTTLPPRKDHLAPQHTEPMLPEEETVSFAPRSAEKAEYSPEKNDRSLLTFSATSLPQIFDILRDYYAHHATKKMEEKHISPTMMETIITRITQKVIDTFRTETITSLTNRGASQEEAEQYFTWRVNQTSHAISFVLKKHGEHDHMLHTDDFLNNELLTLFHKKNARIEHPSSSTIHTSEDIDALFNSL